MSHVLKSYCKLIFCMIVSTITDLSIIESKYKLKYHLYDFTY